MRNMKMGTLALLVTLLLVGALFGVAAVRYDVLIAKQLTVTNATTLADATVNNDLAVGNDLSVTSGDVTVTAGNLALTAGDLAVGGNVNLTAQTAISVTDGAAFTPTGKLQPLTAAGEVTPTLTIPAAGSDYCFYVADDVTIHLADTGNQVLSAAWAGGQYDWLCGWSDGTRFMEKNRSDN